MKGAGLFIASVMTALGAVAIGIHLASTLRPSLAASFAPWRVAVPYLSGTLLAFGCLGIYLILAPSPETAIEMYNQRWDLALLVVAFVLPVAIISGLIAHGCYRFAQRASS